MIIIIENSHINNREAGIWMSVMEFDLAISPVKQELMDCL